MWCMKCFSEPHSPYCANAPEPPVAFICDRCSVSVYEYEAIDSQGYETPDGRIICGTCVNRMSARQVLEFMDCVRRMHSA